MQCYCGDDMVLKLARKGEKKGTYFWGCSNYPECKYSKVYDIPINRIEFSKDDFSPILNSINNKSSQEREAILAEITVQMIEILEHYISCSWGAHFNTMFEKLIKPYLADPSTLDYVLRGNSINENKGNIIIGKTGARIFPELLEYLMKVNNEEIRQYLKNEFHNYS